VSNLPRGSIHEHAIGPASREWNIASDSPNCRALEKTALQKTGFLARNFLP